VQFLKPNKTKEKYPVKAPVSVPEFMIAIILRKHSTHMVY
jgi:hypothetical protein